MEGMGWDLGQAGNTTLELGEALWGYPWFRLSSQRSIRALWGLGRIQSPGP